VSHRAPGEDVEMPEQVGDGPALFSTCTALASRRPAVSFDVRGLYALLGVDWRAGRGVLRAAYCARGGQASRRMTWALKLLLDPVRRLAYDLALTPGEIPDPDEEWARRVEEVAVLSRLHQTAASQSDLFRDKLFVDLAAREGFDPTGIVDPDAESVHDDLAPPGTQHLGSENSFAYGYYRWRSASDDIPLLALWQALVIRAASERGITARVAVGIKNRTPHRWVHTQVGPNVVLFVDERVWPNEEDARGAVALTSRLLRPRDPDTPTKRQQ
jgi:hypothetical protein